MLISKINSLVAECPDCSRDITFETMPHLGAEVTCTECGVKLEVAYLHPLMFDWAYEDTPLFDDYAGDDYADDDPYED
jgi:lysine biosynthesis protein LysW